MPGKRNVAARFNTEYEYYKRRSKGGREPASASGTQSKGGRTRVRGKSTDSRIIRRRKSRRYGQLKV